MILSKTKFTAVARNEKITSCPDLQQLVELRNGYHNITPEDWVQWDLQNAEWERSRKLEFERLRDHFAARVLEKM
jgi:hypothetical protein